MIINASGRTDIVGFYMSWFLNRIEEGYFLIRNPFVKNVIYRIDYDDVDMIVFCTKNPAPLLKNIDKIHKPFILQVTITPYGKEIEPNVPDKNQTIETIKKISKIIGIDKIFVRYDPIFLSDKYNTDYHVRLFKSIVEKLCGYTKSIIISFIDEYKNVQKNDTILNRREFSVEDYEIIGKEFSKIASSHGMTVQTCAEERTLFEYGFIQEDCVNQDLVTKVCGKNINERWVSRNNKYCNCVKMYDVGDYNSCKHLCKYCYANYNEGEIMRNVSRHDPNSPLLIGNIDSNVEIKKILS